MKFINTSMLGMKTIISIYLHIFVSFVRVCLCHEWLLLFPEAWEFRKTVSRVVRTEHDQ